MWEEEQPRRCSVKKALLEISRNLQENACATGSFFNKFFFKFLELASRNGLAKCLRTPFLAEHLRVTASKV